MADKHARFRATVIPSGNAAGVEVPEQVIEDFGAGRRAPVLITVNGHSWRSRVAAMRGQLLIGLSAANRAAAGIELGDEIEMELTLDEQPREVDVPDELAAALRKANLRKAFDALSYSRRRQHALAVENAKTAPTRQRRIEAVLAALYGD
ncbi:DUF1905 domain-containing protein [Nocardia otitidiscaviarum]|uniref:DUF1905 domain-containing protein n=1 Tax=Nocardia otitidiscaviarum TaxID=1823 RepID=A0A516NFP7_9NOCA|nr:YdeI/OmpD-associated family protein [Nocardia otitidiscaviarum]MCP9623043.1 YdeI/OmpD-associated family protein [Nocardia otitidiscaviarum]QDP77711.1 DUF1905 domain-containing protein [Nocardia otitidiscaviarum]